MVTIVIGPWKGRGRNDVRLQSTVTVATNGSIKQHGGLIWSRRDKRGFLSHQKKRSSSAVRHKQDLGNGQGALLRRRGGPGRAPWPPGSNGGPRGAGGTLRRPPAGGGGGAPAPSRPSVTSWTLKQKHKEGTSEGTQCPGRGGWSQVWTWTPCCVRGQEASGAVGTGQGHELPAELLWLNRELTRQRKWWWKQSWCSVAKSRSALTPWTTARQASLSITNSCSLRRLMSIESVMPSNHLILCCPLPLWSSMFPSIRVFSNELALCLRWPKYWSFCLSISPSNEYSELISFRMDWLDLLAVQGTLKGLLQHHSSKASMLRCSAFFMVQLSHPYTTTGKTAALPMGTMRWQSIALWTVSPWVQVDVSEGVNI